MKKTLRSILAVFLLLGCLGAAQGYGAAVSGGNGHYLMVKEQVGGLTNTFHWANKGAYGTRTACEKAVMILKIEASWACVPIWPQ